jgi:hypothetical protein
MSAGRDAESKEGQTRRGARARRKRSSGIVDKTVIPLAVASIGTVALICSAYISRSPGPGSDQQQNGAGRISASASSSAPLSPSPAVRIPAPRSEPSFDARSPTIPCRYLKIGSGQGIVLGQPCDPQKQPGGSATLRYLDPEILVGQGGRFVEAHPRTQSPVSYYNSCFQQPAAPLTQFDTKSATPSFSYFCYVVDRQLVVFVRFMHRNKGSVELNVYEWLPA